GIVQVVSEVETAVGSAAGVAQLAKNRLVWLQRFQHLGASLNARRDVGRRRIGFSRSANPCLAELHRPGLQIQFSSGAPAALVRNVGKLLSEIHRSPPGIRVARRLGSWQKIKQRSEERRGGKILVVRN